MADRLTLCLDKGITHIQETWPGKFEDVLKEKWTKSSRSKLLETLSECLLEPDLTLQICSAFKALLLQLLFGAADLSRNDNKLHMKFCVALSKIVLVYPQSISFAVNYLINLPCFLTDGPLDGEPAKKRVKRTKSGGNGVSDLARCQACYAFLLADAERFRDIYDWSILTSYLEHQNVHTRWYASQAMSIINRLSGKDRQLLLDKYFNKEQQAELLSHQLQLERGITSFAVNKDTDMIAADAVGDCIITSADLHASLTLVSGIILPKIATTTQQLKEGYKDVVVVPSTLTALQNMAMAVSAEQPVILSGHIGAGKTCLVEYLATLTNRHHQLIKVQLGEQIDSKTLLGSYCCTETPGQFVWRPGPLTIAVTTGQWLLLEDIDIAPMDVISSLLTLIDTGTLPSNQGHSAKAKTGFQLFMTKRLHMTGAKGGHGNCSLLEKSVMTVSIQPLSRTELSTIVNSLYTNLSKVVDRLLDMYFTLSSGKHVDDRPDIADIEMVKWTSFYGSRKLSTRDLLRWCSRISDDFELKSADNEISVFQEALDCFCDSLAKPAQRLKLAEAIGTKINVTAEKASYYCNVYKPTIEMSKDMMKVGRTSLDRKHVGAADSLNRNVHSSFAFTRQSSTLLEKICVCVNHREPVLLVGETGTGKTSVVQYLAAQTGRSLTVINMNQQSDSTDLLGGYKPVMISRIISPLREEFESLFCKTFSRKQNQAFLGHIQQCFADKRWADLLKLIEHTVKAALSKSLNLDKWSELQQRLATVRLQVKYAKSALAFSFVEGALVKALSNGDWVLLDEINLATAETLDCLCGLLDSAHGSVTLIERGDAEPVRRHPEFRLFACMNPATDVGKKELTAGVRSRFTEFFVDELENKADLRVMVNAYLSGLSLTPKQIDGIVSFYLAIKQEAVLRLTDGTGKRPTYSLRTLCRALRYAASNPYQAVQRSLYEAFSMSFLTQVDRSSHPSVTKLIVQHIVGKDNSKAVLSKPLLPPLGVECEKFEGYWLKRGGNKPIRNKQYILTETVKANMRDVARVVACGRHPVLLQGETSVGKTSMIEYIAKASGNRCVRINNHEHTDVQEYTGSYVADELGHLVFKEGILVDAMRNGYWIILDELNLAPTDVLEALNRLLDDNRELFIAETQTTVQAHPGFILFATQNPPGLYGGRKMLSRAFRNRFVELHFDEIPNDELEHILHKRCDMPLSSSKKIIRVMSELQLRRRDSGLFAGKQGYITLRDVFRWGERYRQSAADITATFYDWDQLLADQGFMLLAGRVRKPQEELVIAGVLETHFKREVKPAQLFSLSSDYMKHSLQQIKEEDEGMFKHIVWTYSLSRLAVLVGQAMKYNEPVLMVGDTGCGKTTICQYFAHIHERELYTVNCHMHTEGSHFLGGLRPVRHSEMDEDGKAGRLFEWQDGPLVTSMLTGSVLLVDEISLADDSVLERLNSVLEPSRTLVLAEKGGELETITAEPNFRVVATMNPAGDYGKKELSPALRNRFTEIWCPQSKDLNDFKLIIDHNISTELKMFDSRGQVLEYSDAIVQFIEWFHSQPFGRRYTISVRDILAWVYFINKLLQGVVPPQREKTTAAADMYIHGACLVFLDALGSANISDSAAARESCLQFLRSQVSAETSTSEKDCRAGVDGGLFTIGPFSIPIGNADRMLHQYTLDAPSTSNNCLRLVRGLQLNKPILLEGSPGVGKTSLVTALAKASGRHIVRINLSQQTDIADLFGADLPVEGGAGGQFAWRDGLFLQALKLGHWVVLDELNLASQSVLEGLNACFDHRAEVYVPELTKTFHIQHESVKIFACQNPLKQGGGRQGLPQSFLNRFTQVYVDEMESQDQEFITSCMYPDIPSSMVHEMVLINAQMVEQRLPGEYNLRDIFRWCELMIQYQKDCYSLAEHFSFLYVQPLRPSAVNCEKAYAIFEQVTGAKARHDTDTVRPFHLTDSHLMVGNMLMKRSSRQSFNQSRACILHKQLAALESLATCLDMGWMAIVDGPDCSGKSTLAHILSSLVGEELKVFSMNSAMDTTDLLGGFEQADLMRTIDSTCTGISSALSATAGSLLLKSSTACAQLMTALCPLRKETDALNKLTHAENVLDLAEDVGITLDCLAVSRWKESISELRQKASADITSLSGTFEWQDSVLVEAVIHGHWLLVENANICSASVLDRLNSLLEPNGSLTITERGVIDGQSVVIKPHSNFRLILTANTQQTDLSRALKNRGVVISTHAFTQQVCNPSMDEEKLYSMAGISNELVQVLRQEHDSLWDGRRNVGEQVMLERARLFMSYRSRGFDVPQSLAASRSFYHYYAEISTSSTGAGDALGRDIDSCNTPSIVWSIDRMCEMPSMSMLDQLCTDVVHAQSMLPTTAASQSAARTALLERLGVDQLHLLAHHSSTHSLLPADSVTLVAAVQPLLHNIAASSTELSDSVQGLPIDLRWLPDIWQRMAGDCTLTLSCLLNVWSAVFVSRQLLTDVRDLPANSWSSLSARVNQELLDAKHLPHDVVLHYDPLIAALQSLVTDLVSRSPRLLPLTDAAFTQMLSLLELIRRFLCSNTITSATLSWSWLEQQVTDTAALYSCKELAVCVNRIRLLLAEDNTDSCMFNLMWNLFPHLPPINCQTSGPESNGGKMQLALLLQRTIDRLSVYNKGEVKEREKLLTYLSTADISTITRVLASCDSLLHSHTPGEQLAECLLKLSQISPGGEGAGERPAYLCKLWPLKEYWLLRAMLHYFTTTDASSQSDLLDRLSTFEGSPALLQLTINVHRLAVSPGTVSLLLNTVSEWLHSMNSTAAFNLGRPFIAAQQLDMDKQALPSFDSLSVFMVISSLLADDLAPSPQSSVHSGDGGADEHSSQSITPVVCVGKYKEKLTELNMMCREIWSHAPLLDCTHVCDEERRFTELYEQMLLHKDYIPEELKSHSLLLPVLTQLQNLTSVADTGEKWVWLGLIQAIVTAPRGVLDPVVKGSIELKFVSDEISRIELELALRHNLAFVQSGQKLSGVPTHPYYGHLKCRLEELHRRQAELEERSVHRPANEQFLLLVSEAKSLLRNTLHYDSLQQVVSGLQGSNSSRVMAREQMLGATLDNYIHKIVSSYPLYVDCHQPHVNGIKMICYGMRRLAYQSQLSADQTLVTALTNTLCSPAQLYNTLPSCAEGLEVIRSVCESTRLGALRTASLSSQYLRLHLCSTSNLAHSSRRIDSALMSKMGVLMKHYVGMWRSDNDKKAKKELEATSLYAYKQHGEAPETDEQLLNKMTEQSFPSFHSEFSDLVPSDILGDSVDNAAPATTSQVDELSLSLSELDMEAVSELHCNVILSLAHTSWYKGESADTLSTQRTGAQAMILNLNHQIISALQAENKHLEGSVTARLVHLHLISAGVMSAQCLGRQLSPTDEGGNKSANYDIYRDENVAEAVRCMEPLSVVRSRISELLSDWPDHPLLVQVIGIVERIESFAVTDPLMKFTAGLELVLEKLQEWETNAARHVSVQSVMNAVSQLIIEWRKMELDGWKQSLDNVVAHKIRQSSTKYWFHLCSVMLPYMEHTEKGEEQGKVSTVQELADIVIQFLESSTVGDFSYRLRLLQAFTVHIGLTDNVESAAVLNSLYSIWEFYKQFEASVQTHISKKRSGLEKELKNFVKISRWNDMNFWSVRASVDKAHKTLAKHMKSYHDILVCPASNLFTEDVSQLPSVAEIADDTLPTSGVGTPLNFPQTLPLQLDNPGSLQCLSRLPHLTTKFHSACDVVSTRLTACFSRTEAINTLSREVIETAGALQGLSIISGDDKEKQKKQARNIDMRKRKSLATLFHTLHKIGFSYRKGCLRLQNCEDRNSILKSGASPPLDLEVSLAGAESSKMWVDVWKSSVKYMLRSVTRRTVFLDASCKPSKELGVDIVQKLKGYTEHMIDRLRLHHCCLTSHTIHWSQCRQQVLALHRLSDTGVLLTLSSDTTQVPLCSDMHHVATELSSAIPGLTEHIEELKLLLHSLPPEGATVSSPCSTDMLTPMSSVYLYSSSWHDMIGQIDSSLSTLRTAGESLSSVANVQVQLYSHKELRLVTGCIDQLLTTCDIIGALLSHFTTADNKLTLALHTHSALQEFHKRLLHCKSILADGSSTSTHPSLSSEEFASAADKTVRDVLLSCQHAIALLDGTSAKEVDEEDLQSLVDGHLTDSLKLMDNSLKQISLHLIVESLSQLTDDLSCDTNAGSRQHKTSILLSCLPILHQFMSMTQSILTQAWTGLNNSLKLLSILYNIFTHLASRGFCLPEELSDEMDGEGGSDFHTSEGAGLADGQGAKDVSDQIENEDELDDAKRPEDREKEEKTPDAAPPQEDNGIEMSDDFDGAMEDAPATEVDEEDENASSGDEDEMDDQMGDIGDSELKEKLDDKLWGEDEKEDDKEEQVVASHNAHVSWSKYEETGKGSKETKKDLVAKDENPEESTKGKNYTQQDTQTEEKELNQLEKEEADDYNQDEKRIHFNCE